MEVTYVDHMGDDVRVVNAARVSFAKESEWEYWTEYEDGSIGTYDGKSDGEIKKLSDKDQKLISYLARHNHWTPFSHVQITLREKVPIFVARQRFKHMVGFTYNEVSRRYVDDPPEFFVPSAWRKKAENKKQGSGEDLKEGQTNAPYWIDYVHEVALRAYGEMLKDGVAPEQARMVLPQSMYTEYYVTGSLAAWARAYKLRIDAHAQKEIQDLAVKWNEVISNIKELEYSWKALTV